MQVRGRYLVVAWTAVFLAAVGAIAFRTRAGFRMRANVDSLAVQIKELESRKADLSGQVAKLASRPELAVKAKALGLRDPSDSDLVILPVPRGH